MDSTKKTILIIEDEKDIAELLAFNLENDEFNTLLANNGESGIKIARKRKPDLIILAASPIACAPVEQAVTTE